MRGGVLEATLYFDDLTTEFIADGKHLQRELLLVAAVLYVGALALGTRARRGASVAVG